MSLLGAIDAVQAVLPAMRERGRGTLLFTTGGAAVAPSAARASSAVSYCAEVAYARLLHEKLEPEGIRVAHTAIVGALGPGLQHEHRSGRTPPAPCDGPGSGDRPRVAAAVSRSRPGRVPSRPPEVSLPRPVGRRPPPPGTGTGTGPADCRR
ncbi:hypothetical protein [Streptomyces sp. V4I2]|uniref:hypothetical protein n=1 Tax=Streptomyces sp. V4I2 TaxID=3042280 RepID=UPI0035943C01